MTHNDTICAISTPHGSGGIAVIRISGPEALAVVGRIWRGADLNAAASHTAHLGTVIDPQTGSPLDQGVATVFRAPRSYTTEDTVEISVHGSTYIQSRLLEILTADSDCRLAQAGEFTRRAYAAGAIDLSQAEAVADLIAADSKAAHRIAMTQMRGGYSERIKALRDNLISLASLLELELDFSEEDVSFASRDTIRDTASEILSEVTRLRDSFAAGQAIKEGIPVAIVGNTNTGKSSLLNALLGDSRAIVSDIHGTTRDTIEETIHIGDFTFRFIDTAGLRDTADPIERIGIERSRKALASCHIAILLLDPEKALDTDLLSQTVAETTQRATLPARLILAINKTDRYPDEARDMASRIMELMPEQTPLMVSAQQGSGLDLLRQNLTDIAAAEMGATDNSILVTNRRHADSLARAAAALYTLLSSLRDGTYTDLLALDLRQAIDSLAEITGEITAPDILATIFSRFCIGK